MRIFEIVKENVNLREAAELYGIDVNRYGKALCPFHNDRNPSLYVADDHYYCFACGEHGDVIDFAGRLFQLSLYDAARKLMADFHLSPDKPPSAAALHAKRIRTEAQQLMENERLCFSVLSDYARVLRDWKVRYAPQSPDAPVHARFVEACHKLDEMESKYPKSTKYGRQNPITERWNSDEQLVLWRQAWADVTNLHLERTGHEERIDHRSHAERGLLERPTVHEGVVARAMEKKGIISDRCELNRQIKADNALLRELRGQVKKLAQAVKNTIPALADAMENLRKNLLLFCYQLGYLRKGKERLNTSLNTLRPALAQYNQVAKDIRDKTKERRSLLSEKKALSAVHVFRHRELAAKIAALTEDLEELRSEKNLLLASLAYTEEDAAEQFPKDIAAMEQSLKRLEEREQKYSAELDAALNEYAGLREQAQGFDPVQLYEARQAIRPGKEQEAESRAQQVYGEKYSPLLMFDSKKAVSRMLHEDMERQAVRRMMRRAQEGQQIPQKKKDKGQER